MTSKEEFCIPLLKRQESYELIISKTKEMYGTGISKSTLKEIINRNKIIRNKTPRQRKIKYEQKNRKFKNFTFSGYQMIVSGIELYNKAVKLRYFTKQERALLLSIILDYNNLKV